MGESHSRSLLDRRDFLALGASAVVGLYAGETEAANAPISDRDIVLEGIDELYDPSYSALETGYRRLPSGHFVVSAHHRMIGCTGKTVEWWLRRPKSPEEFKRWHPKDHVSIEELPDAPPDPGRIGRVSRVKQYVGGELRDTIVEGRDPSEYFKDLDRLKASGVTAVMCSRGRFSNIPFWGNRIIHVCRDFDWGCEMRSRFWMGPLAPVSPVLGPDVLMKQIPDNAAPGLLKHTLEEYSYLSAFLPDLYQEHAAI